MPSHGPSGGRQSKRQRRSVASEQHRSDTQPALAQLQHVSASESVATTPAATASSTSSARHHQAAASATSAAATTGAATAAVGAAGAGAAGAGSAGSAGSGAGGGAGAGTAGLPLHETDARVLVDSAVPGGQLCYGIIFSSTRQHGEHEYCVLFDDDDVDVDVLDDRLHPVRTPLMRERELAQPGDARVGDIVRAVCLECYDGSRPGTVNKVCHLGRVEEVHPGHFVVDFTDFQDDHEDHLEVPRHLVRRATDHLPHHFKITFTV